MKNCKWNDKFPKIKWNEKTEALTTGLILHKIYNISKQNVSSNTSSWSFIISGLGYNGFNNSLLHNLSFLLPINIPNWALQQSCELDIQFNIKESKA